jgi:hypothetical protein
MTTTRRTQGRTRPNAESEQPEPQAQAVPDVLQTLQASMGNAAVARLVETRNKAQAEPPMPVDVATQDRIKAQDGKGAELDAGVGGEIEASLGLSLPEVRVHQDPEADSLARGLHARAFTQGSDVFLRGDTDTETPRGQETLAHELTRKAPRRRALYSATPTKKRRTAASPG